MAGLWKKFLEPELFWVVVPRIKLATTEYRAPTWSWALVDASLVLGYNSTKNSDISMITISSIEVTVSDSPFLSLKAGFLMITGFLAKVLLVL